MKKKIGTIGDPYRYFFENADDGMVLFDPAGKILLANPSFLEVMGYTTEDIESGISLPDFVNSKDVPIVLKYHRRIISGEKLHEYEFGVTTTEKDTLRFSAKGRSLTDRSGESLGVMVLLREATLFFKRLEVVDQKLTESEGKYSTLMEKASEGVAILQDRRFVVINEKLAQMTGFDRHELEGKRLSRIVSAESLIDAETWYDRIMSGTKAEGAAEIHLMTSNFQPLTAEVTGGLVQYGAKPAVLCLLRDVTDRKDIEDMLIQSERDRAVCELAGATAHELNQPLTVIMGNVELFLDKIEGEDFFARYLHNIYNESLRLANLIKKIGNITRYKSKPYVGTTQIIDIDGASS
jgi:PAS domain S-box-containing protein